MASLASFGPRSKVPYHFPALPVAGRGMKVGMEGDRVVAELPSEQLSAYYLDVVDERGAMISTPPEIVR